MLTSEEMAELFENHDGEYLKFERIPVDERRHCRKDLCAMLMISSKYEDTEFDMVSAAEHDEIFIEVSDVNGKWPFTEDDVIYLQRCGIRWSSEYDCFCSFV